MRQAILHYGLYNAVYCADYTTLAIINVHFTENAQTIAWILGTKVPRERLESSEQADRHVLLVQADA